MSGDLLSNSGWFYSLSCKHTSDFSANALPLSVFTNNSDAIKLCLNKLESEIQLNDKHMIFSSELLEKLPLYHMNFAIDFFILLRKYFDNIVVAYSIRDMVDWSSSIFKQLVCDPHKPYALSINQYVDSIVQDYPKISTITSSWKQCGIDDISIYWYGHNFDDNLRYLLSTVGLNLNIKNPGTINRSIDGDILRLIYYHNINYPSYPLDKKIKLVQNFRKINNKLINTKFNYKLYAIPKKYHKLIMRKYLEDIYNLREIKLLNKFIKKSNYGSMFIPMNDLEYMNTLTEINQLYRLDI